MPAEARAAPGTRPTVLVVGSGYQAFREYLLAGAARVADVVLLDSAPPTWQRPYLRGARRVDVLDPRARLDAAVELAAELGPGGAAGARRGDGLFDGVLTWDERMVLPAAEIAHALGVASMPVEAARACRDKARQRAAFERTGVPSARYRLAVSLEEARSAAAEIGYPVVVKPRSRAASVGVRLVTDEAELAAAVASVAATDATDAAPPTPAAPATDHPGYGGLGTGALIEEQLRGPEISVDAWVLDGVVCPIVVARKRVGFAPYFVETGHIVGAALPDAVGEQVAAVVTAANRALGVDRCVTHTELVLTERGPRVVEVNGRLGGDLIPYLGELTTAGRSASRSAGLSAGGVAARVAAGVRPAPVAAPDRVAGVHFVYPRSDLTFAGLSVPAELAAAAWVHELRPLGVPGQPMRAPPAAFLDRAGYCVVLGDDLATVSARLDLVAAGVLAAGDPGQRLSGVRG